MLVDLYSSKAGEPIDQFLRRRYVDDLASYRDLMTELGLTQVKGLQKLLRMFDIPIRKGSEAVKVQWIDNDQRRQQTRDLFVKIIEPYQTHISPEEDRLHEMARSAVTKAVKSGSMPRVTRLKCNRCDEPADEYHHHSYDEDYWLDVEPLCQSCHSKEHGYSAWRTAK